MSRAASTGEPRRLRNRLLGAGFALVLALGLVLDVFSYGSELGGEFAGWDMPHTRLGRQPELEALRDRAGHMPATRLTVERDARPSAGPR